MVFHWNLSDSKSPQVSRTLLGILTVFNNVVVWMVSSRPPTTMSTSPFSNPLVTVPNAPITIGIIVTFMFHIFFKSLARLRYLSFFSHSFSFILWSTGTAKYYYYYSLQAFHQSKLMVLRWSLRDSKSLQVSRTLLSIQANLKNVLVWMVLVLVSLFVFAFFNFIYHYYICYFLKSFSHKHSLMVSPCCLSDRKSPQVSRTPLSIQSDLNNVVVWLVSTRLFVSNSSTSFTNPFVIVSTVPFTIGITDTFKFHSFSRSLARYVSLFSLSFNFILWSAETAKSTIRPFCFVLFFFFLVLLFFIFYFH